MNESALLYLLVSGDMAEEPWEDMDGQECMVSQQSAANMTASEIAEGTRSEWRQDFTTIIEFNISIIQDLLNYRFLDV